MPRLTGQKRRYFRMHLEICLRAAHGERLQDLVNKLFTRIYGDEFVPTCPWGDKGDLSCDGYLKQPATLFACYGRDNGTGHRRPHDFVKKIRDDFAGARAKWPEMEEWVFVSNVVDGIPGPVAKALTTISNNTGVRHSFFGRVKFEQHLLELDSDIIEDILGQIPVRENYLELPPEIVQEVVSNITENFSLSYLKDVPKPVPENKIAINSIPDCHAAFIKLGLMSHSVVTACLAQSVDSSLGASLAAAFRNKYDELVAQKLEPGAIMDELHRFALGGCDGYKATYQAAAWALLAHLFESCSIFEDKAPEAVK